jgi:G:T-mismatch repair DNA endonuclease (very short patch repair protein)
MSRIRGQKYKAGNRCSSVGAADGHCFRLHGKDCPGKRNWSFANIELILFTVVFGICMPANLAGGSKDKLLNLAEEAPFQ